MTTLHLAVSIRAKAGQGAALIEALKGLVPVSLEDDGCLQYDLHVDREDPSHFFFYEAWRDEAAWHAHNAAPHLARFQEKAPMLVERLVIHQLSRI